MARPKKQPPQVIQSDVKRAAIYLRVSTEEQTQGYGLDDQRAKCLDYARLYDFDLGGEYRDEGISGRYDEDKRDGLAALLAAAELGMFNILIVSALDRIARKASLQLRIIDQLEARGITIHSVKERIDTSTPAGRLLRTILAGVAEMEREVIVERTTGGRNQRGKKDGEKGGRVPYGYTRVFDSTTGKAVGVQIDATAARVVRKVFELRAQHTPLLKIAAELDATIPAPRGRHWYASTISELLKNEAEYRGGTRGGSNEHWPSILYCE
jgi:site-specific DNA recombinase